MAQITSLVSMLGAPMQITSASNAAAIPAIPGLATDPSMQAAGSGASFIDPLSGNGSLFQLMLSYTMLPAAGQNVPAPQIPEQGGASSHEGTQVGEGSVTLPFPLAESDDDAAMHANESVSAMMPFSPIAMVTIPLVPEPVQVSAEGAAAADDAPATSAPMDIPASSGISAQRTGASQATDIHPALQMTGHVRFASPFSQTGTTPASNDAPAPMKTAQHSEPAAHHTGDNTEAVRASMTIQPEGPAASMLSNASASIEIEQARPAVSSSNDSQTLTISDGAPQSAIAPEHVTSAAPALERESGADIGVQSEQPNVFRPTAAETTPRVNAPASPMAENRSDASTAAPHVPSMPVQNLTKQESDAPVLSKSAVSSAADEARGAIRTAPAVPQHADAAAEPKQKVHSRIVPPNAAVRRDPVPQATTRESAAASVNARIIVEASEPAESTIDAQPAVIGSASVDNDTARAVANAAAAQESQQSGNVQRSEPFIRLQEMAAQASEPVIRKNSVKTGAEQPVRAAARTSGTESAAIVAGQAMAMAETSLGADSLMQQEAHRAAAQQSAPSVVAPSSKQTGGGSTAAAAHTEGTNSESHTVKAETPLQHAAPAPAIKEMAAHTTTVHEPDERTAMRSSQDAVFEKVFKEVSAIRHTPASVDVTLSPESLGKVTVNVGLEEGKMAARINVQTTDVKQMMEAAMPKLQEALQSNGIALDSIAVLVNTGSSFAERRNDAPKKKMHAGHATVDDGFDAAVSDAKQFGYSTVEYIM